MSKWRLDPGQSEVISDTMADVLRRKQPWERVEMIGRANRGFRELLGIGVRRSHPDWPEEPVRLEVARLVLGDDEL